MRHDPSALAELIAEDCVVEPSGPHRTVRPRSGPAACVELWRRIATRPESHFLEDTIVMQDRAIILWEHHWGEGENECVRGVNIMRVRHGRIVDAKGYRKAT